MSATTPNTSNRPPDAPAPAVEASQVEEGLSAVLASRPDPVTIARLANEFFSAIPGYPAAPTASATAPPGAATVSSPPATPPVDVGSLPPLAAAPPASTVSFPTEAELRPLPTVLAGAAGVSPQVAVSQPVLAPLETAQPAPNQAQQFPGAAPVAPPSPFATVTPAPGGTPTAGATAFPAAPFGPLAEADLLSLVNTLAGETRLGREPQAVAAPTQSPFNSPYSFFDGIQPFPVGVPGVPALVNLSEVAAPQADPRSDLPQAVASTVAVEAPAPFSSSFYSPDAGRPSPRTVPALTFEPYPLQREMVPEFGVVTRPFNPQLIRQDFPILQETVNGRPLIWLDSAATTQKPNAVIDRISHFYQHENSNIHRAAHALAARSTDAYEDAREKVRRFLNASTAREIIFVRGATEGINLVAKSWGDRHVGKDDEIVITWLEHHANIVPWQQLCAVKGARLRVAPVDDRGQVILEEYEKLINPRTRLVAFSQVSNALGTVVPAREMVEIAHRHGARVLIDGAQAVSHMRVDVQALDCDFYVFSGHKVFAPTGIGAVFGKSAVLDNTPPWQGGGGMIADVTFEKTLYQPPPNRFEAGTGNIADAVGLGAALEYLERIGIENVDSL